MKSLIENLASLSDQLDKIGAIQVADEVDSFLKWIKEEESKNTIKTAIYTDDPDDPASRVSFFIDRAVDRLERAEHDISSASNTAAESRLELNVDDVRFEIMNARRKLEQWIKKDHTSARPSLEASVKNSGIRGLVVDKDLGIAEEEFPGINRYYSELKEKPNTFLQLLWNFLRENGALSPLPNTKSKDGNAYKATNYTKA